MKKFSVLCFGKVVPKYPPGRNAAGRRVRVGQRATAEGEARAGRRVPRDGVEGWSGEAEMRKHHFQ